MATYPDSVTVNGADLKEMRETKGDSMVKVAKTIGLTRNSIYNYESHQRNPSVLNLVKLAIYYHTSVDSLISYKGSLLNTLPTPDHIDISGLDDEQKKIIQTIINSFRQSNTKK